METFLIIADWVVTIVALLLSIIGFSLSLCEDFEGRAEKSDKVVGAMCFFIALIAVGSILGKLGLI